MCYSYSERFRFFVVSHAGHKLFKFVPKIPYQSAYLVDKVSLPQYTKVC